mmetsp:Transcript_9677/g.24849  ORF Transcript_9677/g.24849 Transcript_9677/m.24849 type:complete len:241 (-) Transcript_9677:341-1063(-)
MMTMRAGTPCLLPSAGCNSTLSTNCSAVARAVPRLKPEKGISRVWLTTVSLSVPFVNEKTSSAVSWNKTVATWTLDCPIVSRAVTPDTNSFMRLKSDSETEPDASNIQTRSKTLGSTSQTPLKTQLRSDVAVGGSSSRNAAAHVVTSAHCRSDVTVLSRTWYSVCPHCVMFLHSRSRKGAGGALSNWPIPHSVVSEHWVSAFGVHSVEINRSDGHLVVQGAHRMSAVGEQGATKKLPELH